MASQKHISGAFENELESLKTTFTELGGLVEQQVADAMNAFINNDSRLAEAVKRKEIQINRLTVELDRQAEFILARRQPAATDLRLIVSVLKSSTDLERIGDEAERIAKFADRLGIYDASRVYHNNLLVLQSQVSAAVQSSLDAFARLDVHQARATIASDRQIDELYNTVVQEATVEMSSEPDKLSNDLATMWVARSLERISDHAKNISQTVIYLVHGVHGEAVSLTSPIIN